MTRRSAGALLVGCGVLLGLVVAGSTATVLDYTSTLGFCTSCHEMRYDAVYKHYQAGAHYSNAVGVRARCGDCHYPERKWLEMVTAKAKDGLKDVYHHWIGSIDTEEKFERQRRRLAERVWAKMRANDSLACRNCHGELKSGAMDLAQQNAAARQSHEAAIREKLTCIDCRQGLTHKPV
jgi:nitrate/TMAO reductase-like tetraheme cytochrome c subunit